MGSDTKLKSLSVAIVAIALSVLIAPILDLHVSPSSISWLWEGDSATHYASWEYFRRAPWGLPLGFTQSYGYPDGSTVALTDSIPLFALIFKCIYSVWPLGPQFQYFGLFLACAWIFQVGAAWQLGWVLKQKIGLALPERLALVTMTLLSPPWLYRFTGHTALTAHGFILLAFSLAVSRAGFKSWLVTTLLALLVHPYWWAIVMIIYVASQVFDLGWRVLGQRAFLKAITVLLGSMLIVASVTGLWLPGLQNGGGYTLYSANINTFLNSMSLGAFLPGLAVATQGQYEGFGYLGLGFMVVLGLGLGLLIGDRGGLKGILGDRWARGLGLLALVFFLACSLTITLDEYTLFSLYKPLKFVGVTQLLSVFRSSGRLIWICWYALLVIVIWVLGKRIQSSQLRALIYVAAIVVQFLDVLPLMNRVRTWNQREVQYVQGCPESLNGLRPIANIPTGFDPIHVSLALACGAPIRDAYMGRKAELHEQKSLEIQNRFYSGDLDPNYDYILRQKPELTYEGWQLVQVGERWVLKRDLKSQ